MNHCYPRLVRYEVSATVATERVFLQGNPGAHLMSSVRSGFHQRKFYFELLVAADNYLPAHAPATLVRDHHGYTSRGGGSRLLHD